MSEVEAGRSPLRAVIISIVAVAVAACVLAAGIGIGVVLGRTQAFQSDEVPTPVETDSNTAPSGEVAEASPVHCPPSAAVLGDQEFAPFWEAWNAVEDRYYYDLPSAEDRMHGAIRGMMESLGDQ